MKKFYESPVVEIAVFDFEDIMKTSSNTATDPSAATALINDIEAEIEAGNARGFVGYGKYTAYKW